MTDFNHALSEVYRFNRQARWPAAMVPVEVTTLLAEMVQAIVRLEKQSSALQPTTATPTPVATKDAQWAVAESIETATQRSSQSAPTDTETGPAVRVSECAHPWLWILTGQHVENPRLLEGPQDWPWRAGWCPQCGALRLPDGTVVPAAPATRSTFRPQASEPSSVDLNEGEGKSGSNASSETGCCCYMVHSRYGVAHVPGKRCPACMIHGDVDHVKRP